MLSTAGAQQTSSAAISFKVLGGPDVSGRCSLPPLANRQIGRAVEIFTPGRRLGVDGTVRETPGSSRGLGVCTSRRGDSVRVVIRQVRSRLGRERIQNRTTRKCFRRSTLCRLFVCRRVRSLRGRNSQRTCRLPCTLAPEVSVPADYSQGRYRFVARRRKCLTANSRCYTPRVSRRAHHRG